MVEDILACGFPTIPADTELNDLVKGFIHPKKVMMRTTLRSVSGLYSGTKILISTVELHTGPKLKIMIGLLLLTISLLVLHDIDRNTKTLAARDDGILACEGESLPDLGVPIPRAAMLPAQVCINKCRIRSEHFEYRSWKGDRKLPAQK